MAQYLVSLVQRIAKSFFVNARELKLYQKMVYSVMDLYEYYTVLIFLLTR